MAKLGYTWYPKDWGNSEAVFELTLLERGLYRELIDMAMLNDNKTIINIKTWSRKFGSSIEEIESILITLTDLKLIEVGKDKLFIPSCEPRLKLVRAGSKGGSKSKPTPKPLPKPSSKPTPKGEANQREKKEKVNIKEIESKINNTKKYDLFVYWLGYRSQIKKPIDVYATIETLIKRFKKEPYEKCKWVINNSVENNYQGLFWDNYKGPKKSNNSPIDDIKF
jgi:hypothetical protein